MWAILTPTTSEIFAKKISAHFQDIKFLKFSQNSTFFKMGEFPTMENFLIYGANIGHIWSKFQPDRSIP